MNKGRVRMLHFLLLLLLSLIAPAIQAQSYERQFPQSDRSDRMARFRWEGVVDGTTIIYVHRRQVRTENRSGLPVQRQRYDFTDPLPNARLEVQLEVIEGRGRVQMVQQPHPNNDYTASIRIDDSDRGQSRYVFELRWYDVNWRDDNRPRGREDESFTWSGRVDDESIIRISGNDVRVENIRGYGVSNDRFRFSSPLPYQPTQVSLIDTQGRGEIVLFEQPSQANNYTAAVRIRDRDGGAGSYSFTLTWTQRGYNRPRDDDRRPRDDDWNTGARGLRWSGRVDGRDLIRIRGSQLWIDHQAGGPITEANYRFEQSLPYQQRNVTVRKLRGRGTVRVIEQPSRNNNFTATIMIDDESGGADRYEIEVFW
jgi:hypothetical protein